MLMPSQINKIVDSAFTVEEWRVLSSCVMYEDTLPPDIKASLLAKIDKTLKRSTIVSNESGNSAT